MSNSDEIYELVTHLAHQVAMQDEKLSMIIGKERREYMERMSKGRESVMRLIKLVEESQIDNCCSSFNGFSTIRSAPRVSQQLTE